MPNPDNPPLLIIAGKRLEAEYYARRRNLDRTEWHWVKNVHDIYGRTGNPVLFAGSFSRRADIKALGEAIKTRDMMWQYEPELPYEMPTD